MSLQFISNSEGETTGVFIPINEWNDLKTKYKGIEEDELSIPDWHKAIIDEQKQLYLNDPSKFLDFDSAMDDIEKSL